MVPETLWGSWELGAGPLPPVCTLRLCWQGVTPAALPWLWHRLPGAFVNLLPSPHTFEEGASPGPAFSSSSTAPFSHREMEARWLEVGE